MRFNMRTSRPAAIVDELGLGISTASAGWRAFKRLPADLRADLLAFVGFI